MSVHDSDLHRDVRRLLQDLIDDYHERLNRGESPQVDEYVWRYPEYAAEILRAFPPQSDSPNDLSPSLPTDSALSTSVPQRLGDFRLIREIGRGGMGVVYEAQQISIDRHVALKLLSLPLLLRKERLERFRIETRAAAILDHPNVVSIYQVGEEQDIHYYAMQLVQGHSLADVINLLRGTSPLPKTIPMDGDVPASARTDTFRTTDSLAEAERALQASVRSLSKTRHQERSEFCRLVARVGIQAAEGLQHAHDRGVVHRDIKPGNLLISADWHVWITDFGVARIEEDAGLTQTGDVLGTIRYMAPEQTSGGVDIVDHRADIYSLGITLYELVTLNPAFSESDPHQLLRRVSRGDPVPVRQLDSEIPRELEAIIRRATERDPVDRYRTAGELAEDLRCFLNELPISARPPRLIDHVSRWARRNRELAVAGVCALLLSFIGATLVATWISALYGDAERQRMLASRHLDAANWQQQQAQNARDSLQRELYGRDMELAFAAWQKRWTDEVRSILDQQDQPDLRTFAWYALDTMAQYPPPIVLQGHQGAVREVTVHPDGDHIVSTGDDGTVRFWHIETGELLKTIEASPDSLHALAVSPDGNSLVVGNQQLQLWDLTLERPVGKLAWHSTTIEEAAFSPDGRLVASAARNWHIKLCSLNGECLQTFLTDSGNESIHFVNGGSSILGIRRQPDRSQLCWWNCESGELVKKIPVDSATRRANLVVQSACGRRYVVAESGSEIAIHDADSGALLERTDRFRDSLWDLALAPDDSVLVGAGGDGVLRFWRLTPDWTTASGPDLVEGERLEVTAHQGIITSVAFIDEQRLISAGEDGLIRIWQVPEDRQERKLAKNQRHFGLTPDAAQILASDHEGMLTLQASDTGDTLWKESEPSAITSAAFSADSRRLAVVHDDRFLRIHNREDGRPVATLEHSHDIKAAALSPDGQMAAVTGVDGYTAVWDVDTTQPLFRCRLKGWGRAVTFSPTGDRLVLGGNVPEIVVYQTRDWNVDLTLNSVTRVTTLKFNHQGTLLASGHRNAEIRVWDMAGSDSGFQLKGHDAGAIWCLAFHPEDQLLLSGSSDGLRAWDLTSHRELGVIWKPENTRGIRQAVFSRNGHNLLALGQAPGAVDRLFDLRTNYPSLITSP